MQLSVYREARQGRSHPSPALCTPCSSRRLRCPRRRRSHSAPRRSHSCTRRRCAPVSLAAHRSHKPRICHHLHSHEAALLGAAQRPQPQTLHEVHTTARLRMACRRKVKPICCVNRHNAVQLGCWKHLHFSQRRPIAAGRHTSQSAEYITGHNVGAA